MGIIFSIPEFQPNWKVHTSNNIDKKNPLVWAFRVVLILFREKRIIDIISYSSSMGCHHLYYQFIISRSDPVISERNKFYLNGLGGLIWYTGDASQTSRCECRWLADGWVAGWIFSESSLVDGWWWLVVMLCCCWWRWCQCPEVQGICLSRKFTNRLVLQPQVVKKVVQIIRHAHLG